MNALFQYEQLIENLASNNESMMYFNSGPDHAAVVFSTIFKYATNEVCILAGDMNGKISSNTKYLTELEKFLKRKGKVKILLEEYKKEKNPKLFDLLAQYQFFDSDQIIIKQFDGVVTNTDTKKKIHFCIADDKIYRVEEDTENYVANGSFNDDKTVKILNNIFNEISSKANSIVLN